MLKVVALVAVLAIVAAACNSDSGDTDASGTATASGDLSGGTLKMAMLADVTAAFDPQKEYYSVTWEYYRCCLLRTLMSYKGVPTAQGGADIFPDLAAAEPEVSADGLTWTFTIKPGVNYAPPFQDTEITANDFITAMKRTANPKANVGGYSFYYSVIKGFDDFADGKADTIEGMTAVDDHTLQIELTEPTGDLGYRFAMATSAPIPPLNDGEYGAATGHDKDYGRYLVASGPYMFKGSEDMDFNAPIKDQDPAPGYIPGRSIELVRNPTWSADTDDLRKAYPDEITVSIGGDNDDLYNKVQAGELDFVVDGIVPADKIKQYQSDPVARGPLERVPVRRVALRVLQPGTGAVR